MKKKAAHDLSTTALKKRSKSALIQIILEQRESFYLQIQEKDNRISELAEQLARLNQEQEAQKKKAINKEVNQPSSKQPEWDKDGNRLPAKSGKAGKKRKKRPGCGNQPKSTLKPDQTDFIPLHRCPECMNNLKHKVGKPNPARTIEDTAPPEQKTTIFGRGSNEGNTSRITDTLESASIIVGLVIMQPI
jgi:hypothetical protein